MLENKDIRIRCLEETDLDFVYSCASPKVRGEYQDFRFSSWQTLVGAYERDGLWSEEDGGILLIESRNEAVGMAQITFVRAGLARVGMVLLPENRGQGIGSTVLLLLRDYLMDNYPIARIEADTDGDNLPAQHILENSGFEREGILQCYRYHHGYYHDSLLYSYTERNDVSL